MTGCRRECPVCGALLVAPALFCDADWLAVPWSIQQEIGEAYCDMRAAQASCDSQRLREAQRHLLGKLRKGGEAVRAIAG